MITQDLGAILDALSPYLDSLEIRTDRVCVTVSPLRGRRQVRFSSLMAATECAVETLRETALQAIDWLNAQPDVMRRIVPEAAESAIPHLVVSELAEPLRTLVDAVGELEPDRVGVDLQSAVAGATAALARYGQ